MIKRVEGPQQLNNPPRRPREMVTISSTPTGKSPFHEMWQKAVKAADERPAFPNPNYRPTKPRGGGSI